MKIFIRANSVKTDCEKVTEKAVEILKNHQVKLDYSFVNKEEKDNVDKKLIDNINWCDIIITVGGDGTLLNLARIASEYNKPILGVNTGNLGFLTAIEQNQLELLSNIRENFEIKKHSLLKARLNNNQWIECLNDISISKNMFINTINLSLMVNKKELYSCVCDGIIVSTSTGSTAYSLSAGGPIVDSDIDALVVTPIAPHNLNRTSMLVSKNKELQIKINSTTKENGYISFDGQRHTKVFENDVVDVVLSDKFVNIYTIKNVCQLEKVDKKLKMR